jgi:hypothetical protein
MLVTAFNPHMVLGVLELSMVSSHGRCKCSMVSLVW